MPSQTPYTGGPVAPHPALVLDHPTLAYGLLERAPILIDKLTQACELERRQATPMLCEVLRFSSLCVAAGQALTPSQRIDLAWHEFILCTRLYSEFCQRYLGRFVHHDPGGARETHHHQFQRTLELYTTHFGPPDRQLWGLGHARADHEDAGCGGCDVPLP